ncbi:glycosyltransferase family 39 protein [Ruminococcus sp.]|uniref:glycosyltransferase family 39 protein n=1 Tax=Ruminococcus sp. TaxID=41978 RepID=UPI003890F5F9
MAENKAARMLTQLFNALFCIIFSLLFLEIVFRRYGAESGKNLFWADYRQHLGILLVCLLITTAALLIFRFAIAKPRAKRLRLHREAEKKENTKRTLLVIFIGSGIILLLQGIAAYLLWHNPITDAFALHQYASYYAQNGNLDIIQSVYQNGNYYLIQYPNNFAPMLLMSAVYRLWYLMTGSISRFPIVGLNVLSINAAILMTALLARKTYGGRQACFVLGVSALFVPFYTYTSYVYTDTLSVPYAVGTVYVLSCAMDQRKRVPRYLLYALSGMLGFIGFRMKGNVIVVTVAVLIFLLLKLPFKRFLCAALAFVMGFVALGAVYSAGIKAGHFMTEEQSYEREFPATHWVMMGLHGHGGFRMEDIEFTKAIPGKNEKRAANMEVIRDDLREMGVDGLLSHLTTKAVWTWGDGTYYVTNHIDDPINRNFLHEYVLKDGRHFYRLYAYCCGFQYFLILMLALSALKGFIRPRVDHTVTVRLCVFGVFLFLLMWETRARYLFNFTPFLVFLSVDGADSGVRIIRKVGQFMRHQE